MARAFGAGARGRATQLYQQEQDGAADIWFQITTIIQRLEAEKPSPGCGRECSRTRHASLRAGLEICDVSRWHPVGARTFSCSHRALPTARSNGLGSQRKTAARRYQTQIAPALR